MLNLRNLVDNKYRLRLDESVNIDRARENRIYYYQIPCKYGFIGVHSVSKEILSAYTNRRLIINRLININGVSLKQRGDKEARVLFKPALLDEVCLLLKARKRMKLSPEERAKRIERMKEIRLRRNENKKSLDN
jgi:predicted glycoside hydrolase/deacetylase ChbG (UPF0249 family)